MRAYGIPVYQNKILLIQSDYSPNSANPGMWSLVGGHAENSETPEETMLREFFEEASIRPKNYKKVLVIAEFDAYIFHVKLSKEEKDDLKLGDEGLQLAFFNLKEISNLELPDKFRELLKQNYQLLDKLVHS